MSRDDVRKMFATIEKDSQMRKKYVEMMQAQQKDAEKALAEKLVEFGKTSGFAFSSDDLLAARAELIDRLNANSELSEKDLTGVAGGISTNIKNVAIAFSVCSSGLGCAAMSVSEEIRKGSGGCSSAMSTNGSTLCKTEIKL